MTTTASTTLTASSGGGKPDSPPPGAFVRLAAFDGLFLRSEHLNLMEDYACTLALAVGAASGSGLVHGFEVTLNGTVLSVSQGLAILGDGRPVRTTGALTLDISELVMPPGTFTRVGLMWGTWPFGEEPVQGLLCDAGCGCDGASTHTSRTAEGPFLVLTPADDVPTFTAPDGALRSWIASKLFRDEEDRARRWPATGGTLPSRWSPNAEEPASDTLPLAVLIAPVDGTARVVDTWAVRRDRGAPPPTRYWEWRLGMRPRDVFVAQVLQFQAELDDLERARGGGEAAKELEAGLLQLLDVAGTRTSKESAGDVEQVAGKVPRTSDEVDPGLHDVISRLLAKATKDTDEARPEFVELPPAGFVRATGTTDEAVRRLVEDRLGCPDVVNRVCRCAPGDVGRLFEAAQHRDRTRTRLSPAYDEEHDLRVIDVYVPTRGRERAYDWVLFTRTESVQCEETGTAPATDEVEVFHEVPVLEGPSKVTRLGVLQYPAATWAVPDDAKVFAQVQDRIAQVKEFTLVARVRNEERLPLGYLRAALLGSRFVAGQASTLNSVSTTVDGAEPEAITLLTGDDGAVREVEVRRRATAKAVPADAAAARTRTTARRSTAKKATTTKETPSRATTKRVPARGTR